MSESTQLRSGTQADENWLFELFRSTMQSYIAAAWGWEELLQREGFVTSLPAREFQILEQDGLAIGSYHLTHSPSVLTLNMILVEPDWQRQGYGTLMMQTVQEKARAQGLPIQLRVLQSNPAVQFHEHCGFSIVTRDNHSLEMRWSAD